MISSKNLLTAAATLLLVCGVQAVFAQGHGGAPVPVAVPVDGGIAILAALGGAYALKSLRRRP